MISSSSFMQMLNRSRKSTNVCRTQQSRGWGLDLSLPFNTNWEWPQRKEMNLDNTEPPPPLPTSETTPQEYSGWWYWRSLRGQVQEGWLYYPHLVSARDKKAWTMQFLFICGSDQIIVIKLFWKQVIAEFWKLFLFIEKYRAHWTLKTFTLLNCIW